MTFNPGGGLTRHLAELRPEDRLELLVRICRALKSVGYRGYEKGHGEYWASAFRRAILGDHYAAKHPTRPGRGGNFRRHGPGPGRGAGQRRSIGELRRGD